MNNNIQAILNLLTKNPTANLTSHSRTSEWVLNNMNNNYPPEERSPSPEPISNNQALLNTLISKVGLNTNTNSNNIALPDLTGASTNNLNNNSNSNNKKGNILTDSLQNLTNTTISPIKSNPNTSFLNSLLPATLNNSLPNLNNNNTNTQKAQHPQAIKNSNQIGHSNRNAAKNSHNEHNMLTKSLDESMKRHYNLLSVLCRLCGEICGGINPNTKKRSYAEEIRVLHGLDIEHDQPLVHPNKICYKCRSLLDRIRKRIKSKKELKEITVKPAAEFLPHDANCKICVEACPICFIYDKNMRPDEEVKMTWDEIKQDKIDHPEKYANIEEIDEDSESIPEDSGTAITPSSIQNPLESFLTSSFPNSSPTPMKFTIKKQNISTMNFKKQKSKLKLTDVDPSVKEAGNQYITPDATVDRHKIMLQSVCRLCGGLAIKCREKEHFGEQIHRLCGIDPQSDDIDVHPKYVCSLCCKKFYYRSSHVRPSAQFRSPIDLKEFHPHSDNCPTCYEPCPLCQLHPKMKFNQLNIAIDQNAIKQHILREKEALEKEKSTVNTSFSNKSPINFNLDSLMNNVINNPKPSPMSNTKSPLNPNNFLDQNNTLKKSPLTLPKPDSNPNLVFPSIGGSSNDKLQELLNQLTNSAKPPAILNSKPNQAIQNPVNPPAQNPSPPTIYNTDFNMNKFFSNTFKNTDLTSLSNNVNSNNLSNVASSLAHPTPPTLKIESSAIQNVTHKIMANQTEKVENLPQTSPSISINSVNFGTAPGSVVKLFENMVENEKSLSGVIELLVGR